MFIIGSTHGVHRNHYNVIMDPIIEIADFKIRYGANLNSYILLKNS